MRRTCLAEYKKAELGWPHPVRFSLLSRMNVNPIIRFLIFLSSVTGQREHYQPFYDWMVVASNSSGRFLFDPKPGAPRVFAWMPYNATARPTFFYERPPKIIQDSSPEITSGTDTGFIPPTSRSVSSEALKTAMQEVSTANSAGRYSSSTSSPRYAAL